MDTAETFDRSLTPAGEGQRTFNDGHGRRWIVYERAAPTLLFPERLCLIFESVRAMRRVSVFPPDWRALDGLALEDLSWAR